jgi:Coenzyme PQQ synthesis protein D (PqqD)
MVLSSVAGRILDMIDGRASLRAVTLLLGKEYDAPPETLEQDVVAFAEELLAADVVSVVSVISSASPGIDHA